MRKIAAIIAGTVLALAVLSGCSVSAEEKAACEADGGVVTSDSFLYKHGWWDIRSGSLHYCSMNGTIREVYNKEIHEANEGLFGMNADNAQVFRECEARGGRTYETSVTSGKSTSYYNVCIQDGRYVQLLD